MSLVAETQARERAKNALITVIKGKSVSATIASSDTTTSSLNEELNFAVNENGDKPKAASITQSAHQAFQIDENYQSFVAGALPAGVMQQTFRTEDKGEVFAVAVYIPSLTLNAQRCRRNEKRRFNSAQRSSQTRSRQSHQTEASYH